MNAPTYPKTPAKWIDADKELPTYEEHGYYPRVIVALQLVDHPEYGFGQQWAELRYLGKNKNRPVWLEPGTLKPIETEARAVRYWANPLADPGQQKAAMTREQAIALGRKHAKETNELHSYLAGARSGDDWTPHEWVIRAILEAANE